MNGALVLAGMAMGIAASPHCVIMCGSPCAALTCHGRGESVGFHLGRIAGYAAGGAIVAASITTLGQWAETVPVLQPIWLMVHLAFLALGLWLLVFGDMPRRLLRDAAQPIRIVRRGSRPLRTGLIGLAWVAWPCGALQAALLLSAMANGAAGGALVMGGFAVASMPALAAAPWLWGRWQLVTGRKSSAAEISLWGYRIAGLGLAGSSAWAIAMGLSEHIAAFCRT